MVENNESKPQDGILDSAAAEKASETIDVEKILEKYDRESTTRTLNPSWKTTVKVICILFSLFQLYTAAFGVYEAQIQRSIHLGFVLVLVYLLYPARISQRKSGLKVTDVLFALLGLAVGAYVVIEYTDLMMRAGLPTKGDIIFGAICILLVLEASRRVVGIPITIVAIVFLAYSYFGPYFPGMFAHRGFAYTRIITHMYVTTEGILGMPLGVASTFVYLFILFGAFLHKTGLGKFFIDLALAATGHKIGGPAKVAVMASGLFGTISGSSVANVVTTGTFTIPLMKSIGYKAEFAGAVEAAASTGGQLMPPIMGAAAFVMSQFIGIAYIEIAIAAALPAILYYLAVGLMVHFEAKRLGLQGIPKDRLPDIKKVFADGWHLLLPLFVSSPGKISVMAAPRNTTRSIKLSVLIQYPDPARASAKAPIREVTTIRRISGSVVSMRRSPGLYTKMYGIMNPASASFKPLNPVFTGSPPAMPAPAYAARATGGVRSATIPK
jgi:TRAP transporter 4TM/12TM fusion protein